MKVKKLIAVGAAGCAGALGSPAVGHAQTASTPAPGCQGVQLVDKKGDSSQPSTDILDIFYLTSGGKTTANLHLRDLKPELPDGSTQYFWYVNYATPDGTTYRLLAFLKPDGSSGFKVRRRVFHNADLDRSLYVDAGSLTGKIFPGKDGVVQWELTDAIGGAAGSKLTEHFAAADEVVAGEPFAGTPYLRVVASIDDTVDVPSKEYVVNECAASETPPTGADRPTQPAAPEPTQPAQPGPSGGSTDSAESPKKKKASNKKAACTKKAKKIKNKKKRSKALKKCKKQRG